MTPPGPSRQPITRTDFTPAEARSGLTWLSVGAGMAGLVEVASISVLYGVASILAAGLLGAVFTRTALLWTRGRRLPALVPLLVWICSFVLLAVGPEVTAAIVAENKIRCGLLLAAACAGGVWPIVARK
ncbi:hypothetical protein [Corynebacterium appendicis]|uniref:hypothetical protein n=1 Tax=Corynebacterium appendicis TaxID=163202 RepID=UPI00254DD721|nr:hypothetical protein [Corynebacterium appendicis]MDK8626474.1 hypothetical protein [Corynebacterium appendicis]